MTRKQDLQNTVLDLSHKVVKSFYSRRTETILPLLDEQFLWIGSLSFQGTNTTTFCRATESPGSYAEDLPSPSVWTRM